MKKLETKLLMLLLVIAMSSITYAQNVTLPNVSQKSVITQRLGLSDVTITYHSPSTQGRQVFGGLVPYGNIWRAGANENTTIHFTHDATVEGEKIAAGTYGLYIIPKEDSAILLFSKYNQSWGTNAPDEKDLALKVTVKPNTIPFKEWLSYDFTDRGRNSITAVLQWEKSQIPFKIGFDVPKVVIENFRHELKGLAGFGWRGHMQAARYCLQNDRNLDEAMVWIEKSLASAAGFSNLQVKAGLLAKAGKMEDAAKIMEQAIPTGTPNQLNQYGYTLLGMNKTKEAIKVFSFNVEQNQDDPFVWGFMDSLGEAHLQDGNKIMALKYYKLAKTKAPQNQHGYLDVVIAGIK
jgi:tetratricopeptide (TPR) repeat protein